MNIPEASQVAELIQKLHSIAVHINDRHNHSNLPPVAMGWCEEAIDFLRLYLEAGKEVPEEIHGKHENCFDIDMGYCVTHGEDVDIHPEYMRGFNSARSQMIPIHMADKARIRELETLLMEKESQLASAQEREKWFDGLVEYKIKGKFQSLRAYVEYLEAELSRLRSIGVEEIREMFYQVFNCKITGEDCNFKDCMQWARCKRLEEAIHALYNGEGK